jgi:hypothetical protein
MRFIFAILVMSFGCVLQASDKESITFLICDMTGERRGMVGGKSFFSETPRKEVVVQIKQLSIQNGSNNVITTISLDDESGEYHNFRIIAVDPSHNLSNENKYHLRGTYGAFDEEVVINRFTGNLHYSMEHRGDQLTNGQIIYAGSCKKQTERKF